MTTQLKELVLPIRCRGNPVQVLATLLTKVFLRTHRLVQDSNTTSVLPNLTDVALYEKASGVFRKDHGGYRNSFWISIELRGCLSSVSIRGRKPWVFLVTADAACHFLFFDLFIVFITENVCSVRSDFIVPVSGPLRLGSRGIVVFI